MVLEGTIVLCPMNNSPNIIVVIVLVLKILTSRISYQQIVMHLAQPMVSLDGELSVKLALVKYFTYMDGYGKLLRVVPSQKSHFG